MDINGTLFRSKLVRSSGTFKNVLLFIRQYKLFRKLCKLLPGKGGLFVLYFHVPPINDRIWVPIDWRNSDEVGFDIWLK